MRNLLPSDDEVFCCSMDVSPRPLPETFVCHRCQRQRCWTECRAPRADLTQTDVPLFCVDCCTDGVDCCMPGLHRASSVAAAALALAFVGVLWSVLLLAVPSLAMSGAWNTALYCCMAYGLCLLCFSTRRRPPPLCDTGTARRIESCGRFRWNARYRRDPVRPLLKPAHTHARTRTYIQAFVCRECRASVSVGIWDARDIASRLRHGLAARSHRFRRPLRVASSRIPCVRFARAACRVVYVRREQAGPRVNSSSPRRHSGIRRRCGKGAAD